VSTLLQDRYGAPSRRRRLTIIVCSTILGVVFLGWLTWIVLFHSSPPIDVQVSSYDVISTHQVNVKLQSRFSHPDTDGNCVIQATSSDHNPVGDITLSADQIRAAGGNWIPIRTERRATSVETIRCTESK
jgi:hypothetical protein